MFRQCVQNTCTSVRLYGLGLTLDAAAAELFTTRRTLQRALAINGTTWNIVKAEIRASYRR